MSFLYKRTIQNLSKPDQFFQVLEETELKKIIEKAISNVPHYHDQYKRINLKSDPLISEFQILRKSSIVGNEKLFLSKNKINQKLIKISTSGTTGNSLNLYSSAKSVILETAFIDSVFLKIDSLSSLTIATLRGNKPKNGIYEYKYGHLLLSSYDLNLENTRKYIELIKKFHVNCLHVYPSTIHILCKYLEILKDAIEIPFIKGIYSSSEILSIEDKKLILNTFKGVTLIDEYGQNEHVALCYSINEGYYNFVKGYSFIELIDTGKKCRNNSVFEIVGTGFINDAMPLIRYGTEDYVEIDAEGNIVSIIGRTQDFILNQEKELVPCIVLTREHTLKNVIRSQFFQDKAGELEYRVVVNNDFNEIDTEAILFDMNRAFGVKIVPRVKIVEQIERKKSGKQKRLIQLIDLSQYK